MISSSGSGISYAKKYILAPDLSFLDKVFLTHYAST